MLAKRATLALLAVQALSALASPVDFTVQDSNFNPTSDSICTDSEFVNAPDAGPEVHLDDGVFVGYRKAQTDHYLGIPFALPP
jgi:hypothetical protein